MKKLRFLSILFCALAALSFTSCLNDDDDDNRISPEEAQKCFNLTRGNYTGKLYYPKDPTSTVTNNNDSATVSWSITTDSTMILRDIPAKAIATGIANSEVKEAIASQPNIIIPCYIGYFKTDDPIQWLINPQTVTFDNVTYGGKAHKIQIAFYANNYYSFGAYSYGAKNPVMQLQIVVAGAAVDGQYDRSLIPNVYGIGMINR